MKEELNDEKLKGQGVKGSRENPLTFLPINFSTLFHSKLMLASILLIFLFPFYLYTMSPSVSVGDSGEFIAAATTLALPHAPSYPLFSLLGKCAVLLNPFAHLAYRVNLVSLFFGVGTAILFFFLAEQIGLSVSASLIAAFTFLFSNLLWEPSITAEVFSLNSFFAILLLCCFFLRKNLFQKLCLSSFLLGLGLGNHHTLVLVVPSLLLLYLRELVTMQSTLPTNLPLRFGERVGVRWMVRGIHHLPFSILFFLLGFSIYLYLPIRSFKNPPLDWSNPETFENFWRVITRADYGSLALTLGEKLPRNFQTMTQQILRYCSALSNAVSLPGFLIGIAGWLLWFKRVNLQVFAFFVLFIVSGLGFLVLGNLPFDSQSSGILPRFYLMSAIPFVFAIGQFFERMFRMPVIARVKPVAISIGFLLPIYLFYNAHGHRTFSRHDFAAYDYGRNLLRTLPRNAILFMDGGDDTFYTLAYLTMVEKRRDDLELHDRGGLIYKNSYGDDFRKITKSEKEIRRQKVEESFLGARPLFYSTFNKQILKGATLLQRGILYEAVPTSSLITYHLPLTTSNMWHFYSYRGIYAAHRESPYRLRALVPIYPYLQGLQFLNSFSLSVPSPLVGEGEDEGGVGEGYRYFRRAPGFGTDILWLQTNLAWEVSLKAYELTNQNKILESEALYKFAIEVDPKFVSSYTNLGVLAEKRNDLQLAESYYQKAIEIDPKYADAYYNLGVLYWKQSRWEDVVRMFERTLQLNPNHPSAPHFLFIAKQKLSNKG